MLRRLGGIGHAQVGFYWRNMWRDWELALDTGRPNVMAVEEKSVSIRAGEAAYPR